jgi:hypothetical protein
MKIFKNILKKVIEKGHSKETINTIRNAVEEIGKVDKERLERYEKHFELLE